MAKLSAFEGGMILAIAILCFGVVLPRLALSDSGVLASQAKVLQMEIQSSYDLWRINGGVHGAGDPAHPEVLTQNLVDCLTSNKGESFCSKRLSSKSGRLVLGRSGVYESVRALPSPASVRINSVQSDNRTADFVLEGRAYRGVVVNNQYGVAFDQGKWVVVALN